LNTWIRQIERHRVAAVLLFLLVFPLLMPYEALAVNILVFGL
jgi:branched-chain amino acid transport system permease protein